MAYSGLQGPGLQRVTNAYRGLDGFAGGYKGESTILGKTFINIL